MNKTSLILTATIAASLTLAACATKPKYATQPAAPTPPAAAEGDMQTAGPPAPVRQGGIQALQDELAATAGDRVYFDLDSHALSDSARATLEAQADWLGAHPELRILIAGNCDERGTREYNIALGARRANATRDYLVARGVSASRIDTISYGKERPIDPASSETGWSRNRNAHTGLVGSDPGPGW